MESLEVSGSETRTYSETRSGAEADRLSSRTCGTITILGQTRESVCSLLHERRTPELGVSPLLASGTRHMLPLITDTTSPAITSWGTSRGGESSARRSGLGISSTGRSRSAAGDIPPLSTGMIHYLTTIGVSIYPSNLRTIFVRTGSFGAWGVMEHFGRMGHWAGETDHSADQSLCQCSGDRIDSD